MDLSKVTLQDCIEMKQYKNKEVVLDNGKVIGFVYTEQAGEE